jgi:hypothetical protein
MSSLPELSRSPAQFFQFSQFLPTNPHQIRKHCVGTRSATTANNKKRGALIRAVPFRF